MLGVLRAMLVCYAGVLCWRAAWRVTCSEGEAAVGAVRLRKPYARLDQKRVA